MKKLIYGSAIAFAMVSMFSCSKDDSPTPPPPPPVVDTLVKSLTVYTPLAHSKTIEYMGYDASAQLANLRIYNYDTVGGVASVDSNIIITTRASSTTPITAYDISLHYQDNIPPVQSQHHLLFYDGQNRISRDSVSVASAGDFSTFHYTYDDAAGNTTIEWLAGDPTVPGSYTTYLQIDTMHVSGGNLVGDIAYEEPNGKFLHSTNRAFSAEANPLYNASLSNSLGALLSLNSSIDFKSKNLFTQFAYQDNTPFQFTVNFVWTKDSDGRISQGIGTETTSGLVGQVYVFSY